ncbi:GNAT family N-acetyltransferase [Roseobacter sp. YSTF-M11]|uniref:GNAT family N-acetyltransferase n=1 Tax=Roseobacter insulae TaxID=2859783 RepID=A0A9X1FWL6_9RHOB|nr:GNAT family N-acetyltransferase [Roseobacter insulae]MBW4709400.1 GNAT family N-acetyltransferase [Roseobacter insulae]
MTEEDLPRVQEMVEKLAEHHGDIATVTVEELARDVLGANPWVRILIAEQQGDVVGYAALCPVAQMQFGARGMDLQHLFVEARARRMGAGKALIRASQKQARAEGCTYLSVGTHPENTLVHDIYPAMGFDRLDPPGPRFRIALDTTAG